jgi:hypothetical protein
MTNTSEERQRYAVPSMVRGQCIVCDNDYQKKRPSYLTISWEILLSFVTIVETCAAQLERLRMMLLLGSCRVVAAT